jgi:hypothetical protein
LNFLGNFWVYTAAYLEQNVAVDLDEKNFCRIFPELVKRNFKLHRFSDELTLSEFIE